MLSDYAFTFKKDEKNVCSKLVKKQYVKIGLTIFIFCFLILLLFSTFLPVFSYNDSLYIKHIVNDVIN